jgi:predicted DNA-binding transcriptional regulator AlpA
MAAVLDRFYRECDLEPFTGKLSRSQRKRLIASGEFPAPFRLSDSGRAVAWRESDLIEWQQKRKAVPKKQPSKEKTPQTTKAAKPAGSMVH